jgi:hypothetical protein
VFDGWVPREVHETWVIDPDNSDKPVKTGYVVVTRESDWDDTSRDKALGLTEYEESLCSCGCGLPMSVVRDPEQVKLGYMIHEYRCSAQQATEKHRRAQREKHKDSPEGWDDGLHYYAVPAKESDHKRRTRGDET